MVYQGVAAAHATASWSHGGEKSKNEMAGENQSPTLEFLLQEFLLDGEQEVLFLLFYAIILMRELGPILQLCQYIPCVQHCFLSSSFYVDLCYFSQILSTLALSWAAVKFVHRYFPSASSPTEQFSQVSMIYDPHVSVCQPLCYYSLIMSKRACSHLAMPFFAHGFLSTIIYSVSTSQLFFFDSNILHVLSCPDPKILTLASLDTCPQGNQLFIIGTVSFASSLLTVLISFVCILTVFFKILSSKRRFKAFSSCVSHLSLASLFCETSFFEWVIQFISTSPLNCDQIE
ncbi:olfactory receptor 8H2-like [Trichosurus vulpecula]|uniref:olfactory receptor 8H2-like n=1 Tax=Trichosurus vulpecula TaxID=9337 RepID=UPI00186AC393|nr:olfactory receptor 8H2-like [Trichosurus vulpecula]